MGKRGKGIQYYIADGKDRYPKKARGRKEGESPTDKTGTVWQESLSRQWLESL